MLSNEPEYVYLIFHPDQGFFNRPHYDQQDQVKSGLYLPLELGKWTTGVNNCQTRFASETEARAYTEWLMPAAKAACQIIKAKPYICCNGEDYYW